MVTVKQHDCPNHGPMQHMDTLCEFGFTQCITHCIQHILALVRMHARQCDVQKAHFYYCTINFIDDFYFIN